MLNNSGPIAVQIVSNNDFFYMLFKTFIQQLMKECVVDKIEQIHTFYTHETINEFGIPRLIIVDANIAGISPVDLINELRTEMKYKMPVWFVTEISARQYLTKIMDVGANRIIFKPFDPERIAKEIVLLLKSPKSYEIFS